MNKEFFINNKEELIKIGIALGLVIIALISIFCLSNVFGSKKFHNKSIEHLEEKQLEVAGLTAGTAGAATLLAALPSEAATPLANQIMDMSGYLVLVMGVLFLEKILLTLTGKLTFMLLIPAACILSAIYIFFRHDRLKTLAIKLTTFGIIIFLIVPISVNLSMFIEENYGNTSVEKTLASVEKIENSKTEETKKDESTGFWDSLKDNVTNVVTTVGDAAKNTLNWGKNLLSNFMDAIAVLLITSCVIPMGVLFVLLWIVKLIFGVSVSVNQIKPTMPHFKGKEKKDKNSQGVKVKNVNEPL